MHITSTKQPGRISRHLLSWVCLLAFFAYSIPSRAQANPNKTYRLGLKLTYVVKGEIFRFQNGGGENLTVTAENTVVYFTKRFQPGERITVSQLAGPRAIRFLAFLPVTFQDADIIIPVDSGSPPGFNRVSVMFSGIPGSSITFLLNGKDPVTRIAESNRQIFLFPTLLPTGSRYEVTVQKAPPGQFYEVIPRHSPAGEVGENSMVEVRGQWEYDLVSRGNGDSIKGSFYESRDLAVDKSLDDGRYVVFSSYAKGLCGSSGKFHQVFRRDRITGETIMLSRAPDGSEGNGNSFAPAIAVGNIYIAFESYATNLVPGDNNNVRDVFLWTQSGPGTGNVSRVSVGPNGEEANGESYEPTISGMGQQIAFTSYASNLTGDGVRVDGVNVYVKEKSTGNVTLLSRDYKTGWGTGASRPSISFDGNRIAFCSFSPNLLPDDKNGLWDIFLYDARAADKASQLKRITMAWDGSERNQGTESSSRVVTPTISGDGRFISYATTASNVVPDDRNNVQDAFLYDTETGKTIRLSVNNAGEEGNADSPIGQGDRIDLSADGQWAVFTTNATNLGINPQNVVLFSQATGRLRPLSRVKGTYVGTPSISRNGLYVGFGCGQPLDVRFSSSGLFTQYVKASKEPDLP
jgi:Tol biopolymer transport system component